MAQVGTSSASALGRRARANARLAIAALSMKPPSRTGEALSCELFRQTAYWAARALSGESQATDEGYRDETWEMLDDGTLRAAAADSGRAVALRRHLQSGSLGHFEALAEAERRATRAELHELAKVLLRRLSAHDDPSREARRRWAIRAASLAAVVLTVLTLFTLGQSYSDARRDLAVGRPWRASSTANGGCKSPAQDGADNVGYFFHTAPGDPSPSIEFDLGSVQRFTAVVVKNRLDCCADRAVPLVLEVAERPGEWRHVATRRDVFGTWRATFPPVQARWVRLRNQRAELFHLYRVQILR